MFKIKEIKAKSIITKSGLDVDYVINPYVGCQNSCIYCYARFMKRFTNHQEPWGKFLDIKINAPNLIPESTEKYKNKLIMISSVTDPYQPIEARYKLTRKILEKLIPLEPNLCVMTKSDLILRDIDLLKQFKKCITGVSLSLLDDKIRKEVEPFACSVERRINAVKKLKQAGIKTFIFISPLFPELSDWKTIIEKTNPSINSGQEDFVDEFWFENLNLYPSIQGNIFQWLRKSHPELVEIYQKIYFTPLEISKKSKNSCQKTTKFLTGFTKNDYWGNIEKEIRSYCTKNHLKFSIYFHHRKTFS